MRRLSAILFCILLTGVTARPGEVVKVDESIDSGQIVAFDGKTLQIRKDDGGDKLVSIAAGDVARVQFHESRGSDNWVPKRVQGRLPDVWQVKLSNGDSVSGALDSWSDSQLDIHLQVDAVVLKIPASLVHDIWRVAPELVRKALDLKAASATQDVAYVYKDDDVVAVKGAVLGIENDSLRFVYEGEQKKIKLERILGVVLAPQKRPAAARPEAVGAQPHKLVLLNSDVMNGRWTGLENFKAAFETSWGQTLQVRVASIWRIESIDNSADVYLSALKPAKVEQIPYFDRLIPWRADAGLDGGPLQLNDGHQYSHGVAVHSRCVLEYDLDAKFDQLTARLGFEPIAPNLPAGRVAVRILADTTVRFENPDFRSDQPPNDLKIDIHGAKRLTIEVDYGQGEDVNDRVVFANAKLVHAAGGN